MKPLRRSAYMCGMAVLVCLVLTSWLSAQTSVTTYHNDNYRTGWNSSETVLTPANVNASQFGVPATVTLDDQVDAQPLLVSGEIITQGQNQGPHNVVYVVTNPQTHPLHQCPMDGLPRQRVARRNQSRHALAAVCGKKDAVAQQV